MTLMASEGRGWVRIQPRLCQDTELSKGNGRDAKAESGVMEYYRRLSATYEIQNRSLTSPCARR
jgi:hypothetical protein